MTSEMILDIDSLTAPISEDNLVGIDIREDSNADSLYFTIKDARNSARADERKNLFDAGGQTNDHWRRVLEIAPQILKEQTKDLEIISWYIEALVRLKGFAGLRDGFSLTRQLIEKFWDNLYPMPDEDGIETRVASLTGLNGEGAEGVLIAPIRRVLITEGDDPGPFGYWQYQQALDIQKIIDEEERSNKISALGFGLEDIEQCVNTSADKFFIDLRDDLQTCIDEYRQISCMLDERCGLEYAPPSSNIINILEECLGAVKHLGQNKFPVEDIVADADDSATDKETAATTGEPNLSSTAGGPIRSREQAFKQLKSIADFFRKTEPHSPVSYVLEKAVKWGSMPLHELMHELIPDDSSRRHYSSLTGLKTDEDN